MSEQTSLPEATMSLFLSYSRKDRERIDPVVEALRARGVQVLMDSDDILPTEEWRARLMQLMQEADTVLVALSSNSVESEVCSWEVEYSAALHKRMVPLVIEEVDAAQVPPLLARLNFIFATPERSFDQALDLLMEALRNDIGWIREHTRILGLAQRWQDRGCPARLLLRGQEVAEAEAWRDSRPETAPELTPLQSRFIGDSRRLALRHQRAWVMGASVAALVMAGLSGLAWMQAQEANRQRGLAQANEQAAVAARAAAEANAEAALAARSLAEANAALAEAARVEAEAQRNLAAERLITQNLRAGEVVAAARNLLDFQPESPLLPTLLAGLVPGDGLSPLADGEPLRINGVLHVADAGGGLQPLETGFPARYRVPLPEGTALVSDGGAVLRLDAGGRVLDQSPPVTPFEPCFALDRGTGVSLFGGVAFGYSICSLALREIHMPDDGSGIVLETLRACLDEELPVNGPEAEPVLADDFMGLCINPDTLPDVVEGRVAIGSAQLPMTPISSVRFPLAVAGDDLWQGPSDPVAIGLAQADLRRSYAVPGSPRNEALYDFAGGAVPGYVLMDDLSDAAMIAFRTTVDTGGTGGETHHLCTATPSMEGACHLFWAAGGYEGVTRDRHAARVVLFGSGLDGYEFGGGVAGLWLVDAPGATPRSFEGLDAYGPVLDADFAPDGRILALTGGHVLMLDPESGALAAENAPHGGEALRVLSDGRVLVLGRDALHLGRPGEAMTRIPLPAEAIAAAGRDAPLWLAVEPGDRLAVLGFGAEVLPFALDYAAPVMPLGQVPHRRLSAGPSGVGLELRGDGGLRMRVSGAVYETPGYSGGAPDIYLDPGAVLR